nr:hypothetical protein [Tanacetum cinerariifolium]
MRKAMIVHGRRRDLDKAIDLFNTAQIKGVDLDEKAYTDMICYYGKAGRSDEASILFNQMQEEGIKHGKLELAFYRVLRIMFWKDDLLRFYKEAAELFNTMKRDGFSPYSYTYLALVRAYASSQKLIEAEEVISLMQNEEVGISPSCAHYNLLLPAYAKRGLVEEVERVYELVITAGLTLDVGCYQTMLRVYMDYGFVEKGISLYESISCESVRSDRFIMSAAMHLYRLAGFAHKAEDVLSCMNKMGIPFLKNLGIRSKIRVAE